MAQRPTSCCICGTLSPLVLCEHYGAYTLWQCGHCEGQFWFPFKNPGADWYRHDEGYAFRNVSPLAKPEREHRRFLKTHKTPGYLLDIGMGAGNFLAAAREKGWKVVGVDFDEDALNAAQEVFSLHDVHRLDVGGVRKKFGNHAFDAVTFFQVLEHVEDPTQFLQDVYALLKTGGHVALSTPCRDFADWMKPGDKPPRHLTRWNETALRKALHRAGFSHVVIKKLPVPLWYLIKRFHFWTHGWLSFGLVGKVAAKEQQAGGRREKTRTVSLKVRVLKRLAQTKDYTLFFIPALALFLYLLVRDEHHLDLYAQAQRN